MAVAWKDLCLFVLADYSDILFPYLLENLYYGSIKVSASRNRRQWWVRPWIHRRDCLEHNTAFDLQNELVAFDDTAEFRALLRLDPGQYNALLEVIRPSISKQDTHLQKAVSAEVRLSITLKYLATGESGVSLSQQYWVGRSTVGRILKETCVAIYNLLKDEYLTTPTDPAVWETVAATFWERWNFPNCVGALDMLALVDANYEFLYIDVGAEGRAGDAGVWNRSTFMSSMEEGTLGLPGPKALPCTNINTPHVIVADDAFKLTPSLMKPYSRRNLSHKERIFNYRLSRARRVTENAFGILANRFRTFLKPMHLHPDTATDIVLAACTLHNYLRREVGVGYITITQQERDEVIPNANMAGTLLPMNAYRGHKWRGPAKQVRKDLTSFVVSEDGSVPWQRASVGLPPN